MKTLYDKVVLLKWVYTSFEEMHFHSENITALHEEGYAVI